MIESYYGEPLPPVSLFITSGKLNVFGLPLLEMDDTSLYFTVAPSPYLTERQSAMLYDHLYSRRSSARSNYSDLAEDTFGSMRTFYQTDRETTLGTGVMRNGTWYPLIPKQQTPKFICATLQSLSFLHRKSTLGQGALSRNLDRLERNWHGLQE